MELLFKLLCGHAIADFALQSDFISKFKSHKNSIPQVPWYYVMSAHSLVHAGFVGVITGNWLLAFIEFVLHFVIDYLKCDEKTNIHQDQIAHVVCKIAYCIF